jgi:predicted Zn-dependent protease
VDRILDRLVLNGLRLAAMISAALTVVFVLTERALFSIFTLLLFLLTVVLAGMSIVVQRTLADKPVNSHARNALAFGQTLCALLMAVGIFKSPYIPRNIRTPIPGRGLCLVRLNGFPEQKALDLQTHFQSRYQITTEIRSLAVPIDAFSQERGQIDATAVIAVMRGADDPCITNKSNMVIGLVEQDMWSRRVPNWRNVIWTTDDNPRISIVSQARMMQPPGSAEALHATRLRKMTTKMVGLLYYGLPQYPAIESVLYRDFFFGDNGGVQELDAIGEDF